MGRIHGLPRQRREDRPLRLMAAKLRKTAKSPVLFPPPGGVRKQHNAFPVYPGQVRANLSLTHKRETGRILPAPRSGDGKRQSSGGGWLSLSYGGDRMYFLTITFHIRGYVFTVKVKKENRHLAQ